MKPLNLVTMMPSNRETVSIVHEAMRAAIYVASHLHAAGCLVGAGKYPRGSAKAPKVEYLFRRVASWMRCFADEAVKLDRAIELSDESIRAVRDAVVVGQFHLDPLRFGTSLSATESAVVLVKKSRMTGNGLLEKIARIVKSDERDIFHPDTLRDHAAKLEALGLGKKWSAYDDICFDVELHEQESKSFLARWHEIHLPLEVEWIRIGGLPEAPKPTTAQKDERAFGFRNNGLTWPEVARSILGIAFSELAKADQDRETASVKAAAKRYGKRTGKKLFEGKPGRTAGRKTN
jgi:hypothetical protein